MNLNDKIEKLEKELAELKQEVEFLTNSLDWHPFYYNGLETNIEVTNCGRIRRIKKDWYGNFTYSFNAKYGLIDLSECKVSRDGYYKISSQVKSIGKKTFLYHQILACVFLKHTINGVNYVVDHIDSNKSNNKISNLRVISNRENCSKERTIKSGLPVGVHYVKHAKKYQAQIQLDKKRHNLGYFKTPEEASNAYQIRLKQHLSDNYI